MIGDLWEYADLMRLVGLSSIAMFCMWRIRVRGVEAIGRVKSSESAVIMLQ